MLVEFWFMSQVPDRLVELIRFDQVVTGHTGGRID